MNSPRPLPFSTPAIGAEERAYLEEVFTSGMLDAGAWTARFESRVRDIIGCAHFVATSSGTAALHLALQGVGLGPGDEVIVPALTFVATAQAIRATGAEPVCCDVDPSTANVTADTVAAVTSPRTRAVVPVHLRGHPAPMADIEDCARAHGLQIVEDAAQVFGSYVNESHVGADSAAACFSFGPVKIVTCGTGGGIATRDAQVAVRLRAQRNLGLHDQNGERDVVAPGWRYALPNFHAAIGLGQLDRYEAKRRLRQDIAAVYEEQLAHCPRLARFAWDARNTPTYYWVRVLDGRRDAAREALLQAGFATAVHYPPLTAFTQFAELRGAAPNACRLADEVVTLPLHEQMTPEHAADICRVLTKTLA